MLDYENEYDSFVWLFIKFKQNLNNGDFQPYTGPSFSGLIKWSESPLLPAPPTWQLDISPDTHSNRSLRLTKGLPEVPIATLVDPGRREINPYRPADLRERPA